MKETKLEKQFRRLHLCWVNEFTKATCFVLPCKGMLKPKMASKMASKMATKYLNGLFLMEETKLEKKIGVYTQVFEVNEYNKAMCLVAGCCFIRYC